MIKPRAPLAQLNLFDVSSSEDAAVQDDQPLDEATILERHTDFPPLEVSLTCWLFRQPGSKKLTDQKGNANFDKVLRTVLETLASLKLSRYRRQRECDVTIWIGDPDFLRIGIPSDSPKPLIRYFHERLAPLRGFECSRTEHTSTTPMVPIYRYDQGTIVVYDDPDLAGQVFIDDETGVALHYRQMGVPPEELA